MAKEKFLKFIEKLENNKGKSIGTLIGFIVAILILTIGFFRTLLIVILTWLGYYIGKQVDDERDFKEVISKIIPPNKEK